MRILLMLSQSPIRQRKIHIAVNALDTNDKCTQANMNLNCPVSGIIVHVEKWVLIAISCRDSRERDNDGLLLKFIYGLCIMIPSPSCGGTVAG